MDYSRLFTDTWRFTWQHKWLWLVGGLAVLGSGGGALGRLGVTLVLWRLRPFLSPSTIPLPDALLTLIQAGTPLLWGFGLLFLLLLLSWLLTVWMDGLCMAAALTTPTAEMGPTQVVNWRAAWAQGWRWMGRFVALDALVFLPSFVLALLILLLTGGGVLAAGLAAMQSTEVITAVTRPLLLTSFICLPLLCLLLPVTLAAAVLRPLAFRDTAVFDATPRQSLRHTWQVVRANLGTVLLLLVLLSGGRYILRLGSSLLTTPIFLAWLRGWGPTWLMGSAAIVVSLGLFGLEAVWHTFTAVAWTWAYREISRKRN